MVLCVEQTRVEVRVEIERVDEEASYCITQVGKDEGSGGKNGKKWTESELNTCSESYVYHRWTKWWKVSWNFKFLQKLFKIKSSSKELGWAINSIKYDS